MKRDNQWEHYTENWCGIRRISGNIWVHESASPIPGGHHWTFWGEESIWLIPMIMKPSTTLQSSWDRICQADIFSALESTSLLALATLLDPRFKTFWFHNHIQAQTAIGW